MTMARYEFMSMEKEGDEELLTVQRIEEPRWLDRLFGAKTTEATVQFIGGCTVWYSFPEFKRCGTRLESVLTEFWERARHLSRSRPPTPAG